MNKLFLGASALVLLAACGGDSDDGVSSTVADAGSAAVESAEDAIAALGNITLGGGDASKAEDALAAMSLGASGDGRVAFASRDVDGASARFENLSIAIPEHGVQQSDIADDLHLDERFDGGLLEISALEFEGLDVTDAGATFSRMTLSGMTFEPDDPEAAERADVELGTIELLNPSPELAAWVASLMGNGTPAALPSGDALSFDKLSLANLDVAIDDPDDGSTADVKLASIDIGRAGEDNLGVAALKGLSMDITNGEEEQTFEVSVGSLAIAGAQTEVLDAVAAMSGDFDEEQAAEVFGQLYANPVDPGFNSLEMADLGFNGEGINFSVPSFRSTVQRRTDGEPVAFVTEPYSMTLSADPDGGEAGGELAGALGMIGFETVEITGQGRSEYNPDTDRLTLDAANNLFEVKDAFSMRFGGDIGGYKAYGAAMQGMDFNAVGETMQPDTEALEEVMSAISVHGLELTFDDNSMVDRVFNLVAAQSGEDPQSVRNQAIGMLGMAPMMAGGMGIDMNIVTEATSALSSFLQSPGTLSIKLDPETPLSADTFASMEDPSALTKDVLGFSMTHSD